MELTEKIERITAAVEVESEPSRTAQEGAPAQDGALSHPSRFRAKNGAPGAVSSERKTVSPFMAKIMAEAEGADPKRIDAMLNGLSVEQRIAVKMQMKRAGMI